MMESYTNKDRPVRGKSESCATDIVKRNYAFKACWNLRRGSVSSTGCFRRRYSVKKRRSNGSGISTSAGIGLSIKGTGRTES